MYITGYISEDEVYERVSGILDDIGYDSEEDGDYEDWEETARPSFGSFLDDLDTWQYDTACEAVRRRIIDLSYEDENYAKGLRAAFCGYLTERRDYLAYMGYYDKPKLHEDPDEDDIEDYNDEMERYDENKKYTDTVDKWIEKIKNLEL